MNKPERRYAQTLCSLTGLTTKLAYWRPKAHRVLALLALAGLKSGIVRSLKLALLNKELTLIQRER